MRLQDNPFYLLNVSIVADKTEILNAAKEMAFSDDSDKCEEAKNILLTPTKRLSAEMNWFPIFDQNFNKLLRKNIQQSKPISIDWFLPLAKLNALIYNFSILTIIQQNEENQIYYFTKILTQNILEINRQFSFINADDITETINQYRDVANLPAVSSADVSVEINNIRNNIKQTITNKLSQLDLNSYEALVTNLAEKTVSNTAYIDNTILLDVISEYELRIYSRLKIDAKEIESQIQQLKELNLESEIESKVKDLIKCVKVWGYSVRPIQLAAKSNGVSHRLSEKLGLSLHGLALYLNNERNAPKQALEIANAMKQIFAELDALSEIYYEDSKAFEKKSLIRKQTKK